MTTKYSYDFFHVKYDHPHTRTHTRTCSLALSHGTQQTGRNLVALARLDKHLSPLLGDSRLWAVSRTDREHMHVCDRMKNKACFLNKIKMNDSSLYSVSESVG